MPRLYSGFDWDTELEPDLSQGGSLEFLKHFKDLADPRQQSKVMYPLDEILLLVLCAVLCGADSWIDIADWGKLKLKFLQRFLPYRYGTPSHDTLGILFSMLDPKAFRECFINWVASFQEEIRGVVAIDGKTMRRSFDTGSGQKAAHIVSAWSSGLNLVLGQTQVADKSNEITAIPELLELLSLKGCIVTIDAMGCQREIARKILDKGADYILGLKGNQGTLREDVEFFFTEQSARDFADTKVTRHETWDKGHGRIEHRIITACTDIAWLQKRHDWPGLKSIVRVESEVESKGKTSRETRYYISSSAENAEALGQSIRAHWGIENGLHWVMDMTFRDDDSRIRMKNAPANFATCKHIVNNLLRAQKSKMSMKGMRKGCGWDDDFLLRILMGPEPISSA